MKNSTVFALAATMLVSPRMTDEVALVLTAAYIALMIYFGMRGE